jgi:CMP-N-acetylneuraminate monooxygenase
MEPFIPRHDAEFAPLDTIDGVAHYFAWAGFQGDAVLYVTETDDNFVPNGRAWRIDFSTSPATITPSAGEEPADPKKLTTWMRVRRETWRHVLRTGKPWEEISIGFNVRCRREPDIYDRAFWGHFQDRLPIDAPDWNLAHDRTASIGDHPHKTCPSSA